MLFHRLEDQGPGAAGASLEGREGPELRAKSGPKKAPVDRAAVVWATVVIALFVVAAFVAHVIQFLAGETVFLNLSVAVTSASAGAFIGERLALGKLAG